MEVLRKVWNESKVFRVLLIAALAWSVLRLIAQAFFTFSGSVSDQVGVDLQVYLDAARHFVGHVDLYPTSLEVLEGHFPYPPMFAFILVPFLWLPQQITVMVHFLLHIVFYYLLFARWARIFRTWNLTKAGKALILSIPLWLVFAEFWSDLTYLNIYILMALLSTLLIESVLKDDLLGSSIWLSLILLTKPQWAFAAALPLLLGRYRFFVKLLAWSLGGYLLVGLITAFVGGPDYVWGQFRDYVGLLVRLGRDFPWRGPDAGFLGYNHSIKQIFAYFLGNRSSVLWAATVIKILFIVPLMVIVIHWLFHPLRLPETQIAVVLELVFCLYLGAFIWLDVVWEVSLAIVIFGFLAVDDRRKVEGIIAAGAFLPYALLDVWRLIGYVAGSPMINGSYLQWDYSIYIPTTMIVILTFYAILVIRLWPWKIGSSSRQIAGGSKI